MTWCEAGVIHLLHFCTPQMLPLGQCKRKSLSIQLLGDLLLSMSRHTVDKQTDLVNLLQFIALAACYCAALQIGIKGYSARVVSHQHSIKYNQNVNLLSESQCCMQKCLGSLKLASLDLREGHGPGRHTQGVHATRCYTSLQTGPMTKQHGPFVCVAAGPLVSQSGVQSPGQTQASK